MDAKALSNEEIEKEFRRLKEDANIVFLAELEANTVEELFNNTNHAVIFVSTTDKHNGHWQLLMRNKNEILFFDSYGHNFSKLLIDVFEVYGKNAFNQTFRLGELIVESGIPTFMNTKQYQSWDSGIETCGYHVLSCFAVFLSMPDEFTFELYNKFMDNYKKRNNLKTYDDVAVMVTRF